MDQTGFCAQCGSKILADSKFCDACGAPIPQQQETQHAANDLICPSCGNTVSPGIDECPFCHYQLQNSETGILQQNTQTSSASSENLNQNHSSPEIPLPGQFAETALQSAAGQFGQILKKSGAYLGAAGTVVSNKAEQIMQKPQEQNVQETESVRKRVESETSEFKLCTWLKSSRKTLTFFTNEPNTMAEEEFMEKVQGRLSQNQVGAKLVQKVVDWNYGQFCTKSFVAEIKTKDHNTKTCIVQMKHNGKFSFVSTNLLVIPPQIKRLPPLGKRFHGIFKFFLAGFCLLMLGIYVGEIASRSYYYSSPYDKVAAFLSIAGVICIIIGGIGLFHNSHVNLVEAEYAAANKKYAEWEKEVLIASYGEVINGDVERAYKAVSETIEQVAQEVFQDTKPVVQEEAVNLNTIQELAARNRKIYQ